MPDILNTDNSNSDSSAPVLRREEPAVNTLPLSDSATKPGLLQVKVKYPPFFWSKTQEIINQIENKTNSKVIAYYMHPSATINNEDVDFFYTHIRDLQSEVPVILILVSNGGSGTAAWRIANLLKNYCNHLTVVVPSRCASAATLLSLSAEKILFGPAGYLTAIDTSLTHALNPRQNDRSQPVPVSVDQVNRIKKSIEDDLKNHSSSKSLSEILFDKIHPLVLGELERTSNLSKMIARNMLSLRTDKLADEDIEKLVDILNDSFPTHGYPIVLKEAIQIGLPAEQLPKELSYLAWELIKLYSLISKKTITNITPDLYHLEMVPVLIESLGKRTFFSESHDNRFKPTTGWSIENDKTSWLSSINNPESPEKPVISAIEV
jgi:hypothetical protein